MASKKGPLQTRLEPRRLPLLADKSVQMKVIEAWMEEDNRKLELLCDEMGIKLGPLCFRDLALALARTHCIGFQERSIPGKWTHSTRGYLVVEIERLTADKRKHPAHTTSWAADKLAKCVFQPIVDGVSG